MIFLQDCKIHNSVHPMFNHYQPESVDFKRHLKADKALDKKVIKNTDGRPYVAEYSLTGVVVAEIRFVFTTNADNLMVSRKEVLRYVMNDDTYSGDIVIKNKTFDFTNPVDLEMVLQERERARGSLILEIKGFISGVMQQALGYSMNQVVGNAKPFWSQYSTEISNFIEFGSEDFKNTLLQMNLSETPFGWLSTVLDANGTTVRDYMAVKLTY